MSWKIIDDNTNFENILVLSSSKPQIIFKHSTRCSISDVAKARIEKKLSELSLGADVYFLDLLKNRYISNIISEKMNVKHESPQILGISNRVCIIEQSHLDVRPDEIIEILSKGVI